MATVPGPLSQPPAKGSSKLKAGLVLAAVAVVFGGGGALGADLAIGSPKAAKPRASATANAGPPKVFAAMPSPCDLLTPAQNQQLIQHPKQPRVSSKEGPQGDPGGSCEWQTSSDFPGHDRSIDLTVDMHPSTAQGTGADLAKQVFDTQATKDQGLAGTTKKTTYDTTVYGQRNPISGLGENAYSTYRTITDSTSSFGYSTVYVLRGNVVLTIESSGFDLPDSSTPGAKQPALADADLRPLAEQAARDIVGNLNLCTACAGK